MSGFHVLLRAAAIFPVHVVWMELKLTAFMHLYLVEEMLVCWSWMWCPRLLLCSVVSDLW
jgi:hypothetical protein